MTVTMQTQYSIQEVADLLGVGQSTVRRWIAEGKLRAYRYGARLVRIDAADLRRFRKQIAANTYQHVVGGDSQ